MRRFGAHTPRSGALSRLVTGTTSAPRPRQRQVRMRWPCTTSAAYSGRSTRMRKTSITTALATEFAELENAGSLDAVYAIYLFGSARKSASSRDVDVLVIWDQSKLTPLEATDLRPMMIAALEPAIAAP